MFSPFNEDQDANYYIYIPLKHSSSGKISTTIDVNKKLLTSYDCTVGENTTVIDHRTNTTVHFFQ